MRTQSNTQNTSNTHDDTAIKVLGIISVLTVVILSLGIWYLAAVALPEALTNGYIKGLQDGSNQYHERCSQIGGIMVDEGTLISVHCRGLGKINQQEVVKHLK